MMYLCRLVVLVAQGFLQVFCNKNFTSTMFTKNDNKNSPRLETATDLDFYDAL